jgi:hypothetical protein
LIGNNQDGKGENGVWFSVQEKRGPDFIIFRDSVRQLEKRAEKIVNDHHNTKGFEKMYDIL